MLRCHCFAHLRGLTLCIILTTVAAAEDVPAPPVPPAPPSPLATPEVPQAPVVKFLRSLMRGQTRPSAQFLRDDVACFPSGPEFRASSDVPPSPPSPPAPPTPTPPVPPFSPAATASQPLPPPMYVYDGPFHPGGPHFTMDSAPQTQYCPDLDFANRCHRGSGLLGSDAYAGSATEEALPECHPLPCLVEVRWRNEPVTPEFAAPSPSPPAASECSPTLGVCFPNADRVGHGPYCLDVEFFPAGPAPVQTARHIPRRPPVPQVVPVAAAAPESPHPLTRVQHLQKAAEHLEAAGHPDEAQHLRERAADMQRHARQRLQELREQKQRIEKEIQELEQISGRVDQVQIRVSMLELDEQKLKTLGITFETPDDSQFQLATAHGEPRFKLLSGTLAAAQLHALRKSGAAKVLAEPTVVTTIGRPASIRSGGEFPISIPQSDGTAKLHWENFGVHLEAMPQILEDGRLRLDISSEVAERNFWHSEMVEGFKVPGIRKRRINTQVEMRFDQTLVIGGLSETQQPATGHPHPILNKIPHQHRLFRQVSDTVAEESSARSLVVFVTVEPVPATASITGR
jgi:hypothetical protein